MTAIVSSTRVINNNLIIFSMIVKKTNFGIRVIIPETVSSSEFIYDLRQVKVLNSCFSKHHPIIDELSKREKIMTRKFLLRVHSMENVFKEWAVKRNFNEWDKHNRMDFNEYYHDELRKMEEAINGISFIYHDYCCKGWPSHKYSCCL